MKTAIVREKETAERAGKDSKRPAGPEISVDEPQKQPQEETKMVKQAVMEAMENAGKNIPLMKIPPAQLNDPVKRALIKKIETLFADLLRDSTPEVLQKALEAPTNFGSAAYLLSAAATLEESVRVLDPMAMAILRGAEMKRDMLNRAGGVMETAGVAKLLGISPQGVTKRVRSGTLLAITDASGNFQFPMLQFTENGTVAGLDKVLAAFNVKSPWMQLSVLLDTDGAVGGRRVIDALRVGDLEQVMDVVRSFGA